MSCVYGEATGDAHALAGHWWGVRGKLSAGGGISEMLLTGLLWALWLPWSHSPWATVAVVRNLT